MPCGDVPQGEDVLYLEIYSLYLEGGMSHAACALAAAPVTGAAAPL